MSAGYTIFANGGIYYEPVFLTKITTKSGTELYKSVQNSTEAISSMVAYAMSRMLQAVQGGAIS